MTTDPTRPHSERLWAIEPLVTSETRDIAVFGICLLIGGDGDE